MSTDKTSGHQPTLFKEDVPEMPDGYYSSGPNPNLHRFIQENATQYDSLTDDYGVPPFDRPINTTKATAVYNMHTYWSKKPHDAIRQYIRHYTKPGDLLLDPMCGSGSTALAALMENRAAVAIDLSPAATFITKHYCSPSDINTIKDAFQALSLAVDDEIRWLYETKCDRCDGRATTVSMVHSYRFQCPRCMEKVPLFDCVDTQGSTASGKPKKIKACPYCYDRGHVEEISTRSIRFEPIPVLVSFLCEEGCTPSRDVRRHNDENIKKRQYFENYDLAKLEQINQREIPYWFPPQRMMNVVSETEPWGDEWRPGRDFRTVAELFTKRSLWALALFNNVIDDLDVDELRFAFESNILSASIMQQYRKAGGGFAKGTYYIPSVFIEREQWGCLTRKVSDVVKGKVSINKGTESTDLMISTQSATQLPEIDSYSIDYIFTDPPYAGNVQYGELNFIWEAWMDFDTTWHGDEIIVNHTRAVSDTEWANLLRSAMSECFRILKPGRWLSLCYHDTSEGTWQLVQDLMSEIGFIPENVEGALYIDTGQKSFNQLIAEKVTKRDLVINFRKPFPNELAKTISFLGDEDAATFTEKSRSLLREFLEEHPGSPADRLYDELVSHMVRKGEYERHNFDELLSDIAEVVNGRWYLLETADQIDTTESVKEEAAANLLESFMDGYLAENSTEQGVHYSDLFEQYLPVQDKPRRLLQNWLPEFFFKTASGTWRPPANDEEREQKAKLRASGTLRRIKRFGNALLDGVPPAERDRPENSATAADWIRQCRRAGLYELGRALYEKGGIDFTELDDEAQLEVEEDYQICVRRTG